MLAAYFFFFFFLSDITGEVLPNKFYYKLDDAVHMNSE